MKKIIAFCLILSLYSCKDDNPNPIPNYYTVNITIDVSSFDNDFAIGNIKTFTQMRTGYNTGYAGVVVYRHNLDEFYAYDMACPNDWYSGCIVVRDSTKARPAPADLCLQDEICCGCKFNLLNGYPQSDNKDYRYPLLQYKVTKQSATRFLVHN